MFHIHTYMMVDGRGRCGVFKEDMFVLLSVITAVQSLTIYMYLQQLLCNCRAVAIRFQVVRVLVAMHV